MQVTRVRAYVSSSPASFSIVTLLTRYRITTIPIACGARPFSAVKMDLIFSSAPRAPAHRYKCKLFAIRLFFCARLQESRRERVVCAGAHIYYARYARVCAGGSSFLWRCASAGRRVLWVYGENWNNLLSGTQAFSASSTDLFILQFRDIYV